MGDLSIQVGGNQIIAAGVEIAVFFGPDNQGVLLVFLGAAVCGQRPWLSAPIVSASSVLRKGKFVVLVLCIIHS